MQPDDHWREIYAAKRPEALSWYQVSPSPSLQALDRLGADPSMSLVDVGGGSSTLVDSLLDRGWRDLTVLDIAEPALAASRERLGQRAGDVEWLVADIRDWQPDRAFDVWHDRAVFHFLTEEGERSGYRRALNAGTRPGSSVIIATFAPDGPETCSGLAVRRYDAAALVDALGEGFELIADWREGHKTPWNAEQSFQWCALRRK